MKEKIRDTSVVNNSIMGMEGNCDEHSNRPKGEHGGVGLMVGLNDLSSHFQH